MTTEQMQPCTACGKVGSGKYLYSKISDTNYLDKIDIFQCGMCKTIYLGKYNIFFDEEMYSYYTKFAGKNKDEIFDPLTKKSYLRVLKFLESHGCGKSILDVGCGNGSFVDAALNEGYIVEGIDLSQSAVDIAQKFNLPVCNRSFFSGEIENSSIDILTMFEVMEHVPEPALFLKRAEQVVRPGGLIYITTPNFNSIDRRILGREWGVFHREHLSYFTPSTLQNIVKFNTNLELLNAETRNMSPELISYFRNFRYTKIRGHNKFDDKLNNSTLNEFGKNKNNELRNIINDSSFLSFLKEGLNHLLNLSSLGSTIVLLLRRPY